MEKPRLVASDVDGTLLTPLETVSERTAAAVSSVIAAGTPFVLVTGRPPRWVPHVAQAAGVAGHAVCANGAALYDVGADRVLWQRALDPVLLSDIASALDHALPGSTLAVERLGESAFDDAVPPFVAEHSYRHLWPEIPDNRATRAEVLGHPAVKLLVEAPRDEERGDGARRDRCARRRGRRHVLHEPAG